MNKKILIADDLFVARFGTALVLENHFIDITIDYAENYNDVEFKLKTERFDLLILDINMEGNLFKYMIKEIKKIQQDILILIFSGYDESIGEYFRQGAEGYLNKLEGQTEIIKAVDDIFEKGYFFSSKLVRNIANYTPKNRLEDILSERELQVFRLLLEGNGNIEIANFLNIQLTTVSTYKKRVFTKLNVTKLVDLIKEYY